MSWELQPGEITISRSEIYFPKPNEVVKTLLGSCVAIVIYDCILNVSGVAHVPHAYSKGDSSSPGKYVDTAIRFIKYRLLGMGSKSMSLKAKCVGGLYTYQSPGVLSFVDIGKSNAIATKDILQKEGIVLESEFLCSEHQSLNIRYHPTNHEVKIYHILKYLQSI